MLHEDICKYHVAINKWEHNNYQDNHHLRRERDSTKTLDHSTKETFLKHIFFKFICFKFNMLF